MTSNARFAYRNYVMNEGTEVSVSSGGEDPFYPLTNLQDPQICKTFRSTGSTVVLVFDLQFVANVTCVLGVGHSINGLGFTTCLIEANPLDVWTSPGFSHTMTDIDAGNNFASAFFSAQSFRYWRLTFGGVSDYAEIGKLFIGDYLSFDNNNVAIGFQHGKRDLSTTVKGRYDQRFIDTITDVKTFKGTIGLMTIAEQSDMADVLDYCGTSNPLWFIPDPDQVIVSDKDRLAGYYYLVERPPFTNDFFGLYSVTFDLEEGK